MVWDTVNRHKLNITKLCMAHEQLVCETFQQTKIELFIRHLTIGTWYSGSTCTCSRLLAVICNFLLAIEIIYLYYKSEFSPKHLLPQYKYCTQNTEHVSGLLWGYGENLKEFKLETLYFAQCKTIFEWNWLVVFTFLLSFLSLSW